jgi:hypothetical protein
MSSRTPPPHHAFVAVIHGGAGGIYILLLRKSLGVARRRAIDSSGARHASIRPDGSVQRRRSE